MTRKGHARFCRAATLRRLRWPTIQAIEAKARGFKAILRRSVTVRVVEDVDEVVLSAAEAKALVAGDPDVLKRMQLETEIVKLEALRAAHLDQQVQARWELKRLPVRIADLRARHRRVLRRRPGNRLLPIHADRRLHRFEVTVRPATSGTIRLGLRCPERSDALEYATARTLDGAQVPAYGIGLFQRLDHLFDALDAEFKAAQDGLAREETNLSSYTDQLAGPFEHEQALLFAQRELARIDRKLTHHTGSNGQPGPPRFTTALDDEAAA